MSWKDEPLIAEEFDCHHYANLLRDDGHVLGFVMSFETGPEDWYAYAGGRRLGAWDGLAAAKAAVERSLERGSICGNSD